MFYISIFSVACWRQTSDFSLMNIVTKCEARKANVYKNIKIFDKVSRKIVEKNKTLKILKRELQRLFVTATGGTLQ